MNGDVGLIFIEVGLFIVGLSLCAVGWYQLRKQGKK